MTITYSFDIGSSTFCGIHRLLFRWKGSIWKSIYPELILWLLIYYILSLTYRFFLGKESRIIFEDLCLFFFTYGEYIPITFMLGFYVNAVFTRWQAIFDNVGWIDSPSILIATYVRGTSEEARNIRRNIVRYMVLVQAMVFRDISTCVQKRFPTMDHLVTAGIMTTNELKEFDSVASVHTKYWTPIQWAFLLLRRARDQNMIESDMIFVDILDKIRQYRINVLALTLYDWVPIPLVYTQVVNLAVRSYFIIALLGRQYIDTERDLKNKSILDLWFPIMTVLQFLFYIGWMKVAEVLLNPFGEDDDDFETNWILDRNLQVGFSIVDDCYGRVPDLEHDAFWEDSVPEPLYTPESASRPHNPMVGSCNDIAAQEDALLIPTGPRRLMSVVTPFDQSLKLEENNGIIPVENHNPRRRTSVIGQHQAFHASDGAHARILDSVRRKISRAKIGGRRDSIAVMPSSNANNKFWSGSFTGSLNMPTPDRPGITSNNTNHNLLKPFSQSLNLHNNHNNFMNNCVGSKISGGSARYPSTPPIQETTGSNGSAKSLHSIETEDDYKNSSLYSSNRALNDMLPIIEEVQERIRSNTAGSSSGSNSSDSYRKQFNRSSPERKISTISDVVSNKSQDLGGTPLQSLGFAPDPLKNKDSLEVSTIPPNANVLLAYSPENDSASQKENRNNVKKVLQHSTASSSFSRESLNSEAGDEKTKKS